MFDIFLKDDMNKLLKKKSIVFMGDSNIRALYKDFLCLLHQTQFISQHILRNKMEHTVFGDKLVFHGRQSNGRNYREEREATFNRTKVSFFFLTRVFDDYVKSVLKKLTYKLHPDVIIINCCLWDITRWGCDGVEKYKKNLKLLMKEFKKYVPDCLVIWITAPPIACDVKGGFLVKELQFLKYALRFHVVEANHYARKIVVENGFDVLDSHYHLKMQIHRRSNDGVHWLPPAIRYVTNLLLTHISLAWNVPLPHRYESVNLEKYLSLATEDNSIGANKSKKKEITKITFEDSSVANSCGKIQSARVERNQNNSKSQRASPLCHKVKKNETIHAHMSRIQKEERLKRIHRWHQPNIGDSPEKGTLHSPLQSVSVNRYDSSSSINNEQMKQFLWMGHFNLVITIFLLLSTPTKYLCLLITLIIMHLVILEAIPTILQKTLNLILEIMCKILDL
ncbi:PC-esterase domain-containing protein 1A [Trichonephila clavata]|uniref:PC-esterase domain-containing protein 1A n=1 Tax=Trichonephila clavata TaxID=2740835 RepID=A0A8X6J1V3_TRICU|nr:PC-esterase domain-containing protein 1A [Trichonephila clavata]